MAAGDPARTTALGNAVTPNRADRSSLPPSVTVRNSRCRLFGGGQCAQPSNAQPRNAPCHRVPVLQAHLRGRAAVGRVRCQSRSMLCSTPQTCSALLSPCRQQFEGVGAPLPTLGRSGRDGLDRIDRQGWDTYLGRRDPPAPPGPNRSKSTPHCTDRCTAAALTEFLSTSTFRRAPPITHSPCPPPTNTGA